MESTKTGEENKEYASYGSQGLSSGAARHFKFLNFTSVQPNPLQTFALPGDQSRSCLKNSRALLMDFAVDHLWCSHSNPHNTPLLQWKYRLHWIDRNSEIAINYARSNAG
jgi:hypothetical protein